MPGLTVAEREPTSELPATGVPLLNQSFDIGSEEAIELWADGVPMPPQEHGRMNPDRIRRSNDGQWVVRRDRHKGVLPSHDHTVAWALEQIERLQELGLNVISRAMTSSPAGETMLTVTPWLTDRAACTDTAFDTRITPILNRYFAGATAGSLIFADLRKVHQYSQLPSSGEVLLHDPDAYMCRAHGKTTRPLSQR